MNRENINRWIEKNRIGVVLALVSLSLIAAGILWMRAGEQRGEVKVLGATDASVSAMPAQIVVDVAGAVVHPGIYRLAIGSRVMEALEAAGGLSEEADTDWVEARVNRAAKLTDGQKIFIPTRNSNTQITNDKSSSNVENSKISINSSSQAELESLNGVGEATAKKIIDNRPFQNLEELVSKKCVTQKTYDQIVTQISL